MSPSYTPTRAVASSSALAPRVDCPFCAYPNLPEAKLCSSCGVPVDLVPCEHCEAVNRRESASCYRCGARQGETLVRSPPSDAAGTSTPAPESTRVWRRTAVPLLIATVTVVVFYGFAWRDLKRSDTS